MNYRFKVELEKKENPTATELDMLEQNIYLWQERLGMTRLSDTVFVRETTDNTDLSAACIFGREMSKLPEYLKRVTIFDLVGHNHTVLEC